ncbi:hypothetical protein PVAP13_9NG109473 [Panicum virgatum]|uniref:Uncharacterized protein n=1 Tax=Panicum virgatum TaxID=38727 RepID=A0A8T0MJA0_PANVG|nr:hypothetical protein PVAP13_9NG109473 [Panicum virgatum]
MGLYEDEEGPPRKPRKNVTKARPTEPSTPPRSTAAPDVILHDSPGVMTRRQLAMIHGESSTSQATMASSPQTKTVTSKKLLIRGESSTSQATMASSPQTKKPTSKKLTPKKRKRH